MYADHGDICTKVNVFLDHHDDHADCIISPYSMYADHGNMH
jgi:hypothetical protein